ncbi:stage II sporulation protein D [Heyndrickxia acidicola]|uniref:Stage II sporulation protein D n=1 Tax=Heyndrickxia acidicola TaxID=209389 RepID=A0ABU6MF69_9BACI|nr:stage II sporulation protein D [Heyndrickxia acidicola]MED1202934.1 stage II sporulation protein D [Heyndrickxia acidicola]
MKQMKPVFAASILIIFVSCLIPSLLVLPFSSNKTNSLQIHSPHRTVKRTGAEIEVSVYRSMSNKTETLPLEDYVAGVVASEMPANFNIEALKAQALAARTFIVNHLYFGGRSDLPGGANVTDTPNDQVFHNKAELKKIWGKDYQENFNKISQAVLSTKGLIITYNGEPISASFFSTSNGYTENSEDYWGNKVPYLRSVKSTWDDSSPKFYKQVKISAAEVEAKLGVHIPANGSIGTIISRTAGNRVGTVTIGGKSFTGRQVREALNLASSDFSWIRKDNDIIFTTKGYGHGVGMSQYGANGMAQEGKKFTDIVKYYYKGVQVTDYLSMLEKQNGKKL